MKRFIHFHRSLVVVVIIILSSFHITSKIVRVDKTGMDTIYATINNRVLKKIPVNKGCKNINGFFINSGIVISSYYTVMDSLNLSSEKTGTRTILILSPTSLEDTLANCISGFDKYPHRLLIYVSEIDGKSKICGIYSNLVSNIGGVLSHYNGIIKTANGFKIEHEAGERYSWEYSTYFECDKNRIILNKIIKNCSYNGHSKKIEYRYNKPLNRFNVTDTLNKNCNCDKYWVKFERQ